MGAHGTTPRECPAGVIAPPPGGGARWGWPPRRARRARPSILPDDTHEAAPLAAALLAALPAYAADDLLPEARKVATSD